MRICFFFLLALTTAAPARQVTITVLATTDMHGTLLPYDYFTARESPRGLALLATLIRQERASHPSALLVDCGDTIQGSPLEAFYQQHLHAGTLPNGLTGDPMMRAMNALHYDAMALGNHEFNFGLKNLNAARRDAHFPWLSANTGAVSGVPPFPAYIVKEVQGLKVALVGITTPAIPNWERPENYKGYSFRPAAEALRSIVNELKANRKADVIIVASHSGIDRDPKSGKLLSGALPGENAAWQMAEVPGVDAVVFGHTHQQLNELRVGNTILVQPKNGALSLAELQLTFEGDEKTGWHSVAKHSALLPVTPQTPAADDIVALAKPYHAATEAYLNRPVTQSSAELKATYSRVEDTAIMDAIQNAQMDAAKADVSFCSTFNDRSVIPKGQVTIRQIAALYEYDNELYAIAGTGRMVREALENSARYFNSCPDAECSRGPLISGNVYGFNYDMAQGVLYDIDLTRPAGERIRNLTWRGKPLADNQKLRIAINSYRWAGSGGYTMWPNAPILWRSYEGIRELIVRYYLSGHELPSGSDENWRILPPQTKPILEQEAQGK